MIQKPRRKHSLNSNGQRRTITMTFGYGKELHTLVAKTLRHGLVEAERRWGMWDRIESISTPDTIYADITGATSRGWQPGMGTGYQTEESKLLRIGYKTRPGEVGRRG